MKELTKSVSDAVPWSVAEGSDVAPSVRKFVSRLDTADFNPTFGSEGWPIGAPDGGVNVESRKGNLEDLVPHIVSTQHQGSIVIGGTESVPGRP